MTSWLDEMRGGGSVLPRSNSFTDYLEFPSIHPMISNYRHHFELELRGGRPLRTLTQAAGHRFLRRSATFFLICPRIMPSFGVRTLVLRPYGSRIPVCARAVSLMPTPPRTQNSIRCCSCTFPGPFVLGGPYILMAVLLSSGLQHRE